MTEHDTCSSEKIPSPDISLLQLFLIFSRIGLTTFGGGFSMATVLRHEMVLKRRWLSEKDFLDTLTIATSVPGAVAVNLAFLEGSRLRGLSGAMAAAAGQICPSVLVILGIAAFAVSTFEQPLVSAFLKGAAIAVAGQIAFAALTFARTLRLHWQNLLICGLGLGILSLGFHPIWAILATACGGYVMMHERMAKREWTNEEELHFLGLVNEIVSPELAEHATGKELQSTIRRRREVIKDQFDMVLEKCSVMDLEHSMDLEEFFALASEELARKLDMETTTLAWSLKTREAARSTALYPWMAIPQVVVEDEERFEMLLVRSRRGITFSDSAKKVKAIFVLVGSMDETNFYLCALATIAQIAGSPGFLERWLRVRNPQKLRDLVLSVKKAEMGR